MEQSSQGHTIVRVCGELDLASAPELERALGGIASDESTRVLVNLTDCEFIDSTGIALIIGAWRRIDSSADGSGSLVTCCPNHQVRRLLEITGLDTSVGMYDDPETAIAALNA